MYTQGFLVPVAEDGEAAYLHAARTMRPILAEHGAVRLVECWADEVPRGARTDMFRAVAAEPGEVVAYSWIVWPDRDTCDRAAAAMADDPRLAAMPFDAGRMIFGGFEPLHEAGTDAPFGYLDGSVAAVPLAGRDAIADHCRRVGEMFLDAGASRATYAWGVDLPAGSRTGFRAAVAAGPEETVTFGRVGWPDRATRDAGRARLMEQARQGTYFLPFDGSRMILGGFRPILNA